jgi:rRNA-processing protein FCF1
VDVQALGVCNRATLGELHHEETVLLLRPADRMRGSGPRTRLVGPMRDLAMVAPWDAAAFAHSVCYRRRVHAVVDSSTLISLAWAGVLDLLACSPLDLIVPADVRQETIAEGLARGHADATAIEGAVRTLESRPNVEGGTVDERVLHLSREVGLLITNDVALGRRAANLGAGWLRTADLVVLCVRSGRVTTRRGRAALQALHDSGRITLALLEAYREELA